MIYPLDKLKPNTLPGHKNSHEKWQPLTLGNFFTVSIFLFPYIAKKNGFKRTLQKQFLKKMYVITNISSQMYALA